MDHRLTFDPLDKSPVHLLHRVGQLAEDRFSSATAGLAITPRQYAVLVAVSGRAGLSQTQLVHETGIDRSTLADIVRRMLRKGLLERERTKHDARAYAISLSDLGSDMLAKAAPAAQQADSGILEGLSIKERATFVSLLNQILASQADKDDDATNAEKSGRVYERAERGKENSGASGTFEVA